MIERSRASEASREAMKVSLLGSLSFEGGSAGFLGLGLDIVVLGGFVWDLRLSCELRTGGAELHGVTR